MNKLDIAAAKKRWETLTEEERKKYAVCLKYGLDVPASEVVPILESLSEVRRERAAALEALEEAQGKLEAVEEDRRLLVEFHKVLNDRDGGHVKPELCDCTVAERWRQTATAIDAPPDEVLKREKERAGRGDSQI